MTVTGGGATGTPGCRADDASRSHGMTVTEGGATDPGSANRGEAFGSRGRAGG